jgi:hypothetical protein
MRGGWGVRTLVCRASTHSVTAAQMLPLWSLRAALASCLEMVPDARHQRYNFRILFNMIGHIAVLN